MARVLALYVAKGGIPLQFRCAAARVFTGIGFEGDTQCQEDGSLLFISQEIIDGMNKDTDKNLSFEDLGCHVLVESIDFWQLLGRTFVIGEATLKGIELCRPGFKGFFKLASVLRVQALSSGIIRAGDPIVDLEF